MNLIHCAFFFQAEDGIRVLYVTGVQTCALPICGRSDAAARDVLSVGAREAPRRADGRARRSGRVRGGRGDSGRARRRDPQRRQRRSLAGRAVARQRLSRIALAACVAAISILRVAAQPEQPGSPRARTPVTFLQINDVYATAPVDGAGGLARVAALKRQLADAGRTPFLVLAGDFLSPSVASSVFKGEQMIAALNAAGLDLATLGNHEFDFGDDALIARMHAAKWQWVVSNVVDTRTGKPIGDAAPYIVKSFGALKVGFIGLCLDTSEISRSKLTHTRLVDPLDAAAQYLPRLKRDGAAAIVAVTHLAFATDRALVERFPEIDLIIGGHEHYPITSTENRTLISKAGADARWVARIDVNRRPEGTLERFYELIPITSAIPDDPATAAVVAAYDARLGAELDAVVGTTRVPLDAVSVR